jgi:hypothetical protein
MVQILQIAGRIWFISETLRLLRERTATHQLGGKLATKPVSGEGVTAVDLGRVAMIPCCDFPGYRAF